MKGFEYVFGAVLISTLFDSVNAAVTIRVHFGEPDDTPSHSAIMCYQCSSDLDPLSGHVPVLPFHENCASGGPLPSVLLVHCDPYIPEGNVVTPYDTVGGDDRINYINFQRSEKYTAECAKFYSSQTNTTRRGCALMHEVDSKHLKAKEAKFVNGSAITGNYCFTNKCNHANENNKVSVGRLLGIMGMIFVASKILV
ncbi:uncharacterized protein LOC110859478 [Folsomia candida]|uniref:uncharacterized protein LOC110859478 n=1 Tax=Folsomia candida TaxID=158441 RepID=UPI000B8F86AE|nr:uncharacterized protein LOC110859478 [Folsomia candida]